jgi:WD40 repeat protein
VSNPSSPTLRGSYDTPGNAYDVFVSGNLAYVADYSRFLILDVNDPSSPTLRGSYNTPWIAEDVFVSGDLAYVADYWGGLEIINVSNPSAPTYSGWCDTPGHSYDVFVSGNRTYVADAQQGLQIIDVSNPSSPVRLGAYITFPSGARDVYVSGSLAYVADFESGLQIVDAGNPSSPILRGSRSTASIAYGVHVSGSLAYVANYSRGLQIIDAGNPSLPTLLGSCDTPGYAFGVYVSDGLAYVADDDCGLQIIDIGNPSSPTLRGTYDTPGWAYGVQVSGGLAHVADYGGGLQIINVSNPSSPTLRGAYNTPGYAHDVFVSGGLAYVPDESSGLQIINVSNPSSPTLRASCDTPGVARGVYVSGGMAYVADNNRGLHVIDVSNPSLPVLRGSYDTLGSAEDVSVSGNLAYVADYTGGLWILEYTGPPTPPTSLTATAVSYNRINLSWTDNSENELGFRIERKIGVAGAWNQITTVTAGVTTYPDSGLLPSTTCYYRVRAYNAAGDSAWSNEAWATTFDTPPAAPSLAAEPPFTAGTTNSLSWSSVGSPTGYYLEWATDSSFTATAGNSGWTPATAHLATGLVDGQLYYYRVKCRDAFSQESPWSNVVSSRQDASAPMAPGTPADAGLYTSTTAVRFTWTAAADGGTSGSGVASYDLQVGTSPGASNVFASNVGNVVAWTVTGANGQTLYARVRARDAVGNIGPWSGNSDGIIVDTARPRLSAVTARDSRTLLVTFSEPVRNADRATNYTCSRGLRIVLALWVNDTQYRLYTSEQTATSYTLTVRSGVTDRAGNPMDPAACSRSFTGSAGSPLDELNMTPLQFYGFGSLNCAAYSPDGKYLLTAGSGGAFLWDTATSRVVRAFIGHEDAVVAAAVSANAARVATASKDGTVRVWNSSDATTIQTIKQEVRAVAFSSDQQGAWLLTGSSDGLAQVWSVTDGSQFRRFPPQGATSEVLSVAYSPPDRAQVLTGSRDGTARLWDVIGGSQIRSFPCGEPVAGVAFLGDGSTFLTGSGRTMRVWDASDPSWPFWESSWGSQIGEIASVSSVSYSAASGIVAGGSTDGWVVLRREDDGTTDQVLLAGDGPIASIASPESAGAFLTAVGAPENVPKVWRQLPCDTSFTGHTGPVKAVAFSPGMRVVLTGSDDRTARLWNTTGGPAIQTFAGHTAEVRAVAFSPDGMRVLTGSLDGTARLWDRATGLPIGGPFLGSGGAVRSVAFKPDDESRFLTGSDDGAARLWNVTNRTVVRTFSGHAAPVTSVAFSSPDGRKVLTGSLDGTAKLWNYANASLIRTFSGHSDGVCSVAFSPDGTRVLTGSRDGTAMLWRTADGSILRTFSDHNGAVYSAQFSPDGTRILTSGADRTAKLWNAANGTIVAPETDSQPIRTLFGHAGAVCAAVFSPDGKKLLTGSDDGTARLWPPDAGFFGGHMPAVTAVAVAGDQATTVVTCHEDNVARLWSGSEGRPVASFLGHVARINSVAVSSDGRYLLTGSEDETAKVWDIVGRRGIRSHRNQGRINAVAFSSDGVKYVTAGTSGTAVLRQTSTGSDLLPLPLVHSLNQPVTAVGFSQNGSLLATGGADGLVHLWNTADGTRLPTTLSAHTSDVLSVSFSRTGSTILTSGKDRLVKRWDTNSGALLATFPAHADPVVFAAFSPDDASIVTASGPYAQFWNVSDLALLRTFAGHTGDLSGAALSAGGTRLLTGSWDGTARLWPAFSSGTAGLSLTANKMIIVAGGGDYIGNPIGPQTEALADQSYFTALVRGYRPDEIMYLSAFSHAGPPNVDGYATKQAFLAAIDTWSSDSARLFIHLVDHGSRNPPNWFFRLNENEYTTASELDQHLDDLQRRTNCEVVLIVDCCYAGGFVQQCVPEPGMRRVVVASTTASNLAIFPEPQGAESFSSFFLSFAIRGNNIWNCFDWSRMVFQSMGSLVPGQVPWLDDNRDGRSDKNDGALASQIVLGRFPPFGLNAPTIEAAADTQTVTMAQPVSLWAQLNEAVEVRQVWALLLPEGLTYAPDEPVAALPRVNLAYDPGDHLWKALLLAGSQRVGGLTVVYFAMSEDTLGTRLLATPVARGVTVTSGGYDVRFATAHGSVSEDIGTTTVQVRLSRVMGWDVRTSYTIGGTAAPGVDYVPPSGTLIIPRNMTVGTIPVVILDNALDGWDKTVILTLTDAVGAGLAAPQDCTLTIRDNDPPTTVGFTLSAGRVRENVGVARIPVRLSVPSGKTVLVDYATTNVTALAGQDYVTTSGRLTFTPGQITKTIGVRILSDQVSEGTETLQIILRSPTNAVLGVTPYQLTIDDQPTASSRWQFYR